jgi:hypothetical protein
LKNLIIISVLFFAKNSFSQNEDIIQFAFKDTCNFNITKSFGDKDPSIFYVLASTDKLNAYRFKLSENIKSDSVRRIVASDEHHPYNHTYIFKDTNLDKLVSDSEKNNLYEQTQIIQPRQLQSCSQFKVIRSFKNLKEGFFFSVTDPIFTADKKFAFLDIITYHKERDTKEFRETYFGTTLLIYENTDGKGWTRMKKIDYLIL